MEIQSHGNTLLIFYHFITIHFSKNFAHPLHPEPSKYQYQYQCQSHSLSGRELFQPICFYSFVYLHEPI